MSDIRGFDRAQAEYDNAEPDDGTPLCEACGKRVEDGDEFGVVERADGQKLNVCGECLIAERA